MLGEHLRAARLAAGMTQGRLAELLRVDRNTVWRAELGRTTPRIEMLAEWARICGKTLDDLVTGPTAGNDLASRNPDIAAE